MNPEHIRQLAALLYQTFVETESVAMQGTPDWSDLPDLTRQRWVQMARLLSNRLEDAEIGRSGLGTLRKEPDNEQFSRVDP